MTDIIDFPLNAIAEERALERALDTEDGRVAGLLMELEDLIGELFRTENIPAMTRYRPMRGGVELSAYWLLTEFACRAANYRDAVGREMYELTNSESEEL